MKNSTPLVPLTEGDAGGGLAADTSVARSGETLRQSNWRDELLRAGVRAKGGKLIEFTRVEPLSGTRYLQAEAETKLSPSGGGKGEEPKRVLVCFGPEHGPLEQRMVELALEEAMHLKPKPHMVWEHSQFFVTSAGFGEMLQSVNPDRV